MIRCYVTDRRTGDIVAYAKRAIAEGVDFIQLREKSLPTYELLELAGTIQNLAKGSRTRIVVNDRLDVALGARLDGVHLPGEALPAIRVRPLVDVLSVSTHSLEEALAAEKAHPDFIIFGPIFDTPGKKPVGIEALRSVTSKTRTPILAIGGINSANAASILEAGAAGFAAIRLFQS